MLQCKENICTKRKNYEYIRNNLKFLHLELRRGQPWAYGRATARAPRSKLGESGSAVHAQCGLLLLVLLSPPRPNLINKIMSIQNFNSTIRKSSISYYLSSHQKVLKYGFASDMLPFIWPWAWTITNITCSKKEVHDSPRTMWHTQPNHHIITTESCLGMNVSHGFNDKH